MVYCVGLSECLGECAVHICVWLDIAHGRSGDRPPVSGVTTSCVCANTIQLSPVWTRQRASHGSGSPAGQSEYMYNAFIQHSPRSYRLAIMVKLWEQWPYANLKNTFRGSTTSPHIFKIHYSTVVAMFKMHSFRCGVGFQQYSRLRGTLLHCLELVLVKRPDTKLQGSSEEHQARPGPNGLRTRLVHWRSLGELIGEQDTLLQTP